MSRFSKALAGLGVVLLLASCGPHAAIRAPCPAGKVCLERGNVAEPVSLDPNRISGTWEDFVVSDMIVGLTQADPEGHTIPGMATSWDTSPDGLVWTFHLRDAKWSDGVPVTAEDFVFGMQRLMDPKTAADYASLLYIIKNAEAVNAGKAPLTDLGVAAPDPHTLVITLEHPAPYLAELAQHQTMYPLPKHAVDKWGDKWSEGTHYVANGPYKLVEWKLGANIHLVKNPLFWDADKVCIDEVRFYPTVDPISAERRVRRGELDMNSDIQTSRIPYLRRPDQIPAYVHAHTYLGVNYLAFNGNLPKFKDVRVRQALAMTVDRDFVTQKLLSGVYQPAYNFVPEGVANYQQVDKPAWVSLSYDQRVAEAKRLLAAAGYGPNHPLSFEITVRNSGDPFRIMAALQSDWAAVGVKVTLQVEDSQIAYQDYKARNFEVADAGWIADYNDALSFLYLFQSSTGANNYGDYKNPEFDRLIAASDHEPDLVKREALLRQAEALMQADYPVITTWYTLNKNLVNPRVIGFVDNLIDKHRTRYLCLRK